MGKRKKDTDISETVSEKPKRGRPKINADGHEDHMRRIYHEVKTTRGIQNKIYASRTINVLLEDQDPCLKWLFDVEANVVRATILTELGRLWDRDVILRIAKQICELKRMFLPASSIEA